MTTATLTELPLASLVERPGGNYRPVDPDHVGRLAERIEREGFRVELGCPNVRDMGDGRFEIVSGHHRIAAARRLGWDAVPCAVVEVEAGAELLADQVAENACRREAPASSEAVAFAELAAAGWSVESIAQRIGRRRDYVERRLALADLDPGVRWVADRHGLAWAEPLAGLPGDLQRALVRVLDTDGPNRSQWDRLIAKARETASERLAAESALFGWSVETWSSELGDYVSDVMAEPELPAVEVVREPVLGLAEVADRLGVATATAHKWRTRALLPAPDLEVSRQPAWFASTVDQWARQTGRK